MWHTPYSFSIFNWFKSFVGDWQIIVQISMSTQLSQVLQIIYMVMLDGVYRLLLVPIHQIVFLVSYANGVEFCIKFTTQNLYMNRKEYIIMKEKRRCDPTLAMEEEKHAHPCCPTKLKKGSVKSFFLKFARWLWHIGERLYTTCGGWMLRPLNLTSGCDLIEECNLPCGSTTQSTWHHVMRHSLTYSNIDQRNSVLQQFFLVVTKSQFYFFSFLWYWKFGNFSEK